MAISFNVEDGTIVSNANSYVTVAEYQQYWENRGIDYSGLSDATIQPLLIKATQFIDSNNWLGGVVDQDQSLMWPRYDMFNRKGKYISTTTIPNELKWSVCEVAKYIYVKGDISKNESNISSKSIGPISVTYSTSKTLKSVFKEAYSYINIFLDNEVGYRA